MPPLFFYPSSLSTTQVGESTAITDPWTALAVQHLQQPKVSTTVLGTTGKSGHEGGCVVVDDPWRALERDKQLLEETADRFTEKTGHPWAVP